MVMAVVVVLVAGRIVRMQMVMMVMVATACCCRCRCRRRSSSRRRQGAQVGHRRHGGTGQRRIDQERGIRSRHMIARDCCRRVGSR
uniref:Uncharacterized protein n=1 Tax=Anopheles darlingi TaxID=43151 RepID=A0A2M4DS31_ANODA